MQAYGEKFARVYNLRWWRFAESVAPRIMELYESTPVGSLNKTVLDLCCGTGQLASLFLKAGYSVVGLDSSAPMLHYARENAGSYVDSGQARFVQGDAGRFALKARFGLIVSTYDALNHLDSEEQLVRCFGIVFSILVEGGLFVFDLNTALGLRRWNSISIDDSSEEFQLMNRGFYDESINKAWTQVTGFIQRPDGLYESFDQKAYNTVFKLARVEEMLRDTGWSTVHFARMEDLKIPLADPESEGRVFVVAEK